MTLEVWNGAAATVGGGGTQTTTQIDHVGGVVALNQWSGAQQSVTWAGNIATTATPHGFQDGTPLLWTGALPTGLSAGVVTYVRYLTTTTFQVADTLAHALNWNVGSGPNPILLTIGNGTPVCRQVHARVVFDSNTPTLALQGISAYITDTNVGASQRLNVTTMPVAASAGDHFVIYPTLHQSARFSATVNGSTAFVYGHAQVTHVTSQKYTFGSTLEASWLKFGSDATATVVATNLSGSITSYELIPDNLTGVSATVASNTITVTMPVEAQLFVIVNDDWLHPLALDCAKLKTAIPTHTTYDGTQTNVAAGTCLYLAAGCYNIGAQFKINGTGTLYGDYGVYAIGSLDYRAQSNAKCIGPGNLSGEGLGLGGGVNNWQLNFSAGVLLCAVLGQDNSGDTTQYNQSGNEFRDWTIVDPAYYFTNFGPQTVTGNILLSGWTGGVGAVGFQSDYITKTGTVDRLLYLNADDHWQLDYEWRGLITVTRVVHLHTANNCFHISYWPFDETVYTTTDGHGVRWSNCWARSIATFDTSWNNPTNPTPNAIFAALVSGQLGDDRWMQKNRWFDHIYIQGPTACPVWKIENHYYPFASSPAGSPGTGLRKGQIQNMSWTDITIVQTPGVMSTVQGLDWLNTPHDHDWRRVRIGGVLLTTHNFSTFFLTNAYVYNLRVGGRNVVADTDICNLALSRIGQAARVTSISPPDDTTEAKLCAKFLPLARNTLTELHQWSFATKRVALTPTATSSEASSYDFAYELPDDWLDIIAVIPSTATDDYAQPGVWVDASGELPTQFQASQVVQYTPVDYAIEQDSTGAQVLYTDLENAVLRYTAYVTDFNLYPPTLIEAMSWYLAGQLAGALMKGKEGADMARFCSQTAMSFLAQAREGDSAMRQVRPAQSVSWIDGR